MKIQIYKKKFTVFFSFISLPLMYSISTEPQPRLFSA